MLEDNMLIAIGFSLLKHSGYIDPGALSGFMVVILGAVVGIGMTLKLYWYKIKQKISRNKID
ncbi:MAG: hypothetical protein CXT78_10305 [Thaumarchaeota archaeon]|jgi:NADH:ubiquinone oxidoreductase subunit K|nr:MAG: hypothetical protein CXT78_10305 [Nitrososphaerota archaeon]